MKINIQAEGFVFCLGLVFSRTDTVNIIWRPFQLSLMKTPFCTFVLLEARAVTWVGSTTLPKAIWTERDKPFLVKKVSKLVAFDKMAIYVPEIMHRAQISIPQSLYISHVD